MKLFRDEPGRDALLAAVGSAQRTATALVAYVEACWAIARPRQTAISSREIALALAKLDAIWADLDRVEVDADLIQAAGELALRHLLRALDALHLAAAVQIASGGTAIVFASWDGDQREAARREGFEVIPAKL